MEPPDLSRFMEFGGGQCRVPRQAVYGGEGVGSGPFAQLPASLPHAQLSSSTPTLPRSFGRHTRWPTHLCRSIRGRSRERGLAMSGTNAPSAAADDGDDAASVRQAAHLFAVGRGAARRRRSHGRHAAAGRGDRRQMRARMRLRSIASCACSRASACSARSRRATSR